MSMNIIKQLLSEAVEVCSECKGKPKTAEPFSDNGCYHCRDKGVTLTEDGTELMRFLCIFYKDYKKNEYNDWERWIKK